MCFCTGALFRELLGTLPLLMAEVRLISSGTAAGVVVAVGTELFSDNKLTWIKN